MHMIVHANCAEGLHLSAFHFPCNSFDIITIYAYFNSQFFSYLIKVYK